MTKQLGPRRYEVVSNINFEDDSVDEYFSLSICDSTEKHLFYYEGSSPKNLAKIAALERTLKEEDTITTIPQCKINARKGKFPVSNSELIEFYQEFKRCSNMKRK